MPPPAATVAAPTTVLPPNVPPDATETGGGAKLLRLVLVTYKAPAVTVNAPVPLPWNVLPTAGLSTTVPGPIFSMMALFEPPFIG